VPNEKHLWAQSYEGDLQDTLALQNSVAHAIAQLTVPPALSAVNDRLRLLAICRFDSPCRGRDEALASKRRPV